MVYNTGLKVAFRSIIPQISRALLTVIRTESYILSKGISLLGTISDAGEIK
jgi:hypothetical protein